MARTASLTEAQIARATAPATGERTLWDPSTRGFGVRLRGSKKVYVVLYRTHAGRLRRMTLGDANPGTLDAVRRQARALIARAGLGDDPAHEKRTKRDAGTVAALLERALDEHWEGRSKPSTYMRVRWLIAKVINPKIGSLATVDVTTHDIEELHRRLAQTPRQANLVLATLSRAFTLAERWGLRPKYSNPVARVERFAETHRDRVPTAAEYAAAAAALAELEASSEVDAGVAAALRFLVLSGCRLGEALALRWRHIDVEGARLRLEDAKTGARDVPIGGVTLALLAARPRREGDGEHFVFSGGAEPLSHSRLSKAWDRVRQAAGCSDLRLHDLRHGVGTATALAGANAFQVRAKLGHKTMAMAARYVNKLENHARALSDRVEESIAAQMAGTSAEILPAAAAKAVGGRS